MSEKRKRKPDELLMEGIGFDEADLEANRRGELGRRQLARLHWLRRTALTQGQVWGFIASFILFAGLAIFIGGLVAWSGRFLLMGGIGLLVGIILLRDKGWQNLKAAELNQRDVSEAKVRTVEGRISLNIRDAGHFPLAYKIQMEDQQWVVRRETFLAFKNGDPYILYCAPYSKVLLAAEWLREPPLNARLTVDDKAGDEQEIVDEKPKRGRLDAQ
jgi:hypothetical protein